MLEKLKKFEIKKQNTIIGGDAPEGWVGQCNSDGSTTYYGPNGSWYTIH